MGLSVFWTEFAEQKLTDIYDYYQFKASKKIALKLVNEIIDKTIDLEKTPLMGQIEELLKERSQKFRYLIYKNYKIIYWINDSKSRIEIVNVFDTRQNPTNLSQILS